MAVVVLCGLFSRDTERLTRESPGPKFFFGWPTCEFCCVGESTDSGEKMTLPKRSKVAFGDSLNTALIHFSVRQMSGSYQVAQPSCAKGIVIVVVNRHAAVLQTVTGLQWAIGLVLFR
jgi:hypothetical protein